MTTHLSSCPQPPNFTGWRSDTEARHAAAIAKAEALTALAARRPELQSALDAATAELDSLTKRFHDESITLREKCRQLSCELESAKLAESRAATVA